MAMVLVEGFDHMNAADLSDKGWTRDFTLTTGRFGGKACALQNTEGKKALPASYAEVIVHFAMQYKANVDGTVLVGLRDSGTKHVECRYTVGTSTFSVTRNGTSLGTFVKALTLDQWYWIEFRALISDTVGQLELKVDTVQVINLTGQDTRNGANASVNEIWISDGGTFMSSNLDDLIIVDPATGGAPTNTFLGDSRVETLMPSGNGNSSQLVGSDGNSTDNYLLVDETTPNQDTDYVESSTVGEKDTYAYGNLTPTTGTVYGVQPCLYARKTDAGVRSVASIARLSGTEVDSANHTLGSSYQYFTDIREAKPGGGVWTITDVNNAEFGVKVTA